VHDRGIPTVSEGLQNLGLMDGFAAGTPGLMAIDLPQEPPYIDLVVRSQNLVEFRERKWQL
jgi:hypothetical protein